MLDVRMLELDGFALYRDEKSVEKFLRLAKCSGILLSENKLETMKRKNEIMQNTPYRNAIKDKQ